MSVGTYSTSEQVQATTRVGASIVLERVDWRNLGVIAFIFIWVVALISPTRLFPISDDNLYAHSVGEMIKLNYQMPIMSQANLLSHVAWGALFASLFGYNFTVLSISTLVMSAGCLTTFYLLLRHLDVSPTYALLGTGLLGFNPLYLFLSYSFMTEVTFITYMLAACLFLVRGLKGYGERWLWLGGAATALSYLTRQHGLLILVAALVYLFLSHSWSWRRAIAISTLPVAAAIGFALWQRTQPPSLVGNFISDNIQNMLSNPIGYFAGRTVWLSWIVLLLGLYLAPLARLPRRLLVAIPIFALLALSIVWSVSRRGSVFPVNGNMLDNTGLVKWYYNASIIWPEWVWGLLGVASAALLSLYCASLLEFTRDWWRARRERNADPALMVYLVAVLMVLVITFVMPTLNDRYILPLLPILMIPALRCFSVIREQRNNTSRMSSLHWRWILIGGLGLFSLLACRDYMEHSTVRWNQAENLAAQGVPRYQIDAGYEWQDKYLLEDGLQRLRESGDFPPRLYPPFAVLDPVYLLSDVPVKGYDEIGSQPYYSWLNGGEQRRVLLLKRQ